MRDPNREDFARRVARLRRLHAQGRGLEAAGTLGRQDVRRAPAKKRRPLLRAGLGLLGCALGLKALLVAHIGAEAYAARLAILAGQNGLAPVQALFLQPDPVTLALARVIGAVARPL